MAPAGSIRSRLLRALLTVALLTLAISATLSAALDLRILRESAERDLRTLAAVVGENCISALVFNSPETARRQLATLAAERQVQRAVLTDAGGRPFTAWEEPGGEPGSGPAVTVTQALQLEGEPVGRITLHARLGELHRQALRYLLLSGVLAMATMTLVLLVVLRLQRRIAAPILALADKARQVAAQDDLSLRVTHRAKVAELDTLSDALNSMLAGIEAREGRIRAQAAALGEANEKLRRLAMDLSLMEQSEKSRLAALLHDSPMQKLALAQMQLESGLHEPDAEGRQLTEAGLGLLREASAELRTLQFELSPPILEQEGLPAALAWLAERMGERGDLPIECRLPAADAADRPPLSPALSVTLFQCARELVYNMIKHAYASRGSIALDIDAESVCLSVADDGRGFRAPAASTPTDDGNGVRGGFGLYSIRERVHLLHGDMHIDTAPSGSRVSIRLPLAETGTTAP